MLFSWLAMGIIATLSLGGIGGLWLVLRRVDAHAQMVATRLRVLQEDLAAICTCQTATVERDQTRERELEQYANHLQSLENRLEAIEQRLRQLSRRQDEQLNPSEPSETSYGAAIRLAHQGADVEQLVNTFGLARGEAELIAALHHAQHEQQST